MTGPNGPSPALVKLVFEIKDKNPGFGCERIALLVTEIHGVRTDDQTVRRILRGPRPHFKGSGPSWLAKIGKAKDALWCVDLI